MLFCKFWNTVISKTTIESKSATKPFVNVTRPSKAENKIIPIIESDSTINLKIADTKQAVTGVHSSVPKTKGMNWSHFSLTVKWIQKCRRVLFFFKLLDCFSNYISLPRFFKEKSSLSLGTHSRDFASWCISAICSTIQKKNERTENIWKSVSALNWKLTFTNVANLISFSRVAEYLQKKSIRSLVARASFPIGVVQQQFGKYFSTSL